MAKYSYDFKLKVVKEYLEGDSGYTILAKKYNVSSKSVIQDWVHAHSLNGANGLKHKTTKKSYSGDFKLRVLQYRELHGLSYLETANHFYIHSGSIISNWQQLYNKNGYKALSASVGRPAKMLKQTSNKSKKTEKSEKEELILLREENEYLKMSIEYEKKLEALVQLRMQKTKKKRK